MAEQIPEKFCEFQRKYNRQYNKFHCAVGDFQCSNPICSYSSKVEMPEEGCDIANKEGKLAKTLIEGLAREGLLP